MWIGGDFTSCEKRCSEVSLSYRYKCENVCNWLNNHSDFDWNLWYYNTIQDEHDRIEGSVRDLRDLDNWDCQFLWDCHSVCNIKWKNISYALMFALWRYSN